MSNTITKIMPNNWLKSSFIILTALLYALIYATPAFSATLTTASLTLGDPRTGETTSYTFLASGFSTGTVLECIQLELATTSAGGTPVTGIDTTGAALDASSTLITESGWTKTFTANGVLELTDGTEAPISGTANLVFTGIDNGSTENVTYFAILNTYTNNDCSTGLTDTVTVAFVYKNGELVSLTIDPSLTFSCAAVGSGQDIYPIGAAGPLNTTVASTALGIDHASTVNSTTNGISAHDLTTTTNATNGFNVYIRHTGLLTNGASDTIATGALSAASFPAPGTEAWAWTSDDSTLAAPLNGSGSGLWNSFTSTNAVIARETDVASTTDRVGHQVGVAGTTPAGTYTTTIVYTAVAIY
jgi:hypothetical protein